MIRFGRLTRDGFLPGVSVEDRERTLALMKELGAQQTNAHIYDYAPLKEIGFINPYWVTLGDYTERADTNSTAQSFVLETFTVQVSETTIEILLQANETSQLFAPLKDVTAIFGSRACASLSNHRNITTTHMLETERYLHLVGKLTDRQVSMVFPECLTQEIMIPVSHVQPSILYLDRTEAYTVLEDGTLVKNHLKVPPNLGGTVLYGVWTNRAFCIWDVVFMSGLDLRSIGLERRLRRAKRIAIDIDVCEVVAFCTENYAEHAKSFLEWSPGVAFLPGNRPYGETCMTVYYPVENTVLILKTFSRTRGGYKLFELTDRNGEAFAKLTPFSREDRQFIALFPENTYLEFRWESNSLIPHSHGDYRPLVPMSVVREHLGQVIESPRRILLRIFKSEESNSKMATKQTRKLKMLPVNKSVVFFSPVEGEDVLVRTGTISEGSCFFHALLHAYSKDYATMDRKGRMRFVRRLRANMAGKLDQESWEEMGNGIISKVPFQENVLDILVNFYRFVDGNKEARGRSTRRVIKKLVSKSTGELNAYQSILELVPLREFEQKILPSSYSQTDGSRIDACCDVIKEKTCAYLDKCPEMKSLPADNSTFIQEAMKRLIDAVTAEAIDSAFKAYVKGLERVSEEVDGFTIDFISERFKRDIYFLDGKSRLPYNNFPTSENLKGRKSMILIWVGDNHYEVVGRLLPGNRIQREFPHDDVLVERIKMFLMEPDRIPHAFPDLEKYLPSEHRTSNNELSSQPPSSSSEDESDPYYDSSEHPSSDDESDQ